METAKPKKALRGLFLRTEKKASEVEVDTENEVAPPSEGAKKVLKASTVELERKPEPTTKAPDVDAEGCDVTSNLPFDNKMPLMTAFQNSSLSTDSRADWNQDSYVSFLRKLDRAQTEVFLMKGKILAEAKEKFFLDNKTGWKNFCSDTLDMNYTTANQYIRVAEEFEDIASAHPEFGFEHFKALLPLPPEQRLQILSKQESLSVKRVRTLAQTFLETNSNNVPSLQEVSAKTLVKNLENLKEQLFRTGTLEDLPQLQKWQVAAACANLSEELGRMAATLNRPIKSSSSRVGAETLSNET
jgi:hypothetical protein